jgi:hypothetical protein
MFIPVLYLSVSIRFPFIHKKKTVLLKFVLDILTFFILPINTISNNSIITIVVFIIIFVLLLIITTEAAFWILYSLHHKLFVSNFKLYPPRSPDFPNDISP